MDECESLDGIALVGWDRIGVMETLVLLVVFEEVSLALGEALSERPRGARRHLQFISPECTAHATQGRGKYISPRHMMSSDAYSSTQEERANI